MTNTISVTEAQSQLPKLLRELDQTGAFTVQRHGKLAAFVLSPARMEAIIESMELLANRPAMETVEAYEKGRIPMRKAEVLNEDAS